MKLNKFLVITMMSLFFVSVLGEHVFDYGDPPEQSSSGNYAVFIHSKEL